MIDVHKFLTKNSYKNVENAEKFAVWQPKIQAYNEKLQQEIQEYLINLPKPQSELWKENFDAVNYLYSNKLLSDKEFAITDSSCEEIIANVANSKWKAVEVVEAFGKRAVIAHQFTNCAVEIFIKEGLERAKYLDDYLAQNGKTIGPLHGLPISLKEHLNYKGKITNGSFVGMIDNIAINHNVTTQILEDLGAVFYVRTNQPQGLMHLDSNNNITGFTKNPFNLLLSSGGSSSGEGAIVAFGGSPLGIGTDIGGSIRGPAAISGCNGFKPTSGRVSLMGDVNGGGKNDSVPVAGGPMTRSVGDIRLWMDSYINHGKPHLLDPSIVPLPWRKIDLPQLDKITFGVIYDDGIVKPSPPVLRGLKKVIENLKAAGSTIVEWEPLHTDLAIDTIKKLYNSAGNEGFLDKIALSGEPITILSKWSSNYGDGERMFTASELYKLKAEVERLKVDYYRKMDELKIDFLISPVYSCVAPKSEEAYNWSYTALFNILDFPGLTLQTGLRADSSIDLNDETKPRTDYETFCRAFYDPSIIEGAPIAVQIVGKRYQDEEVVAIGEAIEKLIKPNLFKK